MLIVRFARLGGLAPTDAENLAKGFTHSSDAVVYFNSKGKDGKPIETVLHAAVKWVEKPAVTEGWMIVAKAGTLDEIGRCWIQAERILPAEVAAVLAASGKKPGAQG